MARVERRSVVEVAVLEVAPGSRSLNGVVGIHKVVGEHRRERVDIMGVPGADSAVIQCDELIFVHLCLPMLSRDGAAGPFSIKMLRSERYRKSQNAHRTRLVSHTADAAVGRQMVTRN
jgi:hypothetical protein